MGVSGGGVVEDGPFRHSHYIDPVDNALSCPGFSVETRDEPKALRLRSMSERRRPPGLTASIPGDAGSPSGEMVKALVQAFEENEIAMASKSVLPRLSSETIVPQQHSHEGAKPKDSPSGAADVHIKVWTLPRRQPKEDTDRTLGGRRNRNGRTGAGTKNEKVVPRLSPKWKRQFSCLSPRTDVARTDTPRPAADPQPERAQEVTLTASPPPLPGEAAAAAPHKVSQPMEIPVEVFTSGARELCVPKSRSPVEFPRLASIDENRPCGHDWTALSKEAQPSLDPVASPEQPGCGAPASKPAVDTQARMTRQLAYEACREDVKAEEMAFGIGVKPLAKILQGRSFAEAAAAAVTVGALARNPVVAKMYVQHGMLHSLLDLIARAMPEFTVPAIQDILAANAGCDERDVQQTPAAALQPMAAVLDLALAINLPFKSAWHLLSLALPDQEAQCLRERLQSLVCILLVKWHEQDTADARQKQKHVFGKALEPDLDPWFSVFACPAAACVLACCWALSVIARTQLPDTAEDRSPAICELVCKVMQAVAGFPPGHRHVKGAWLVVERMAQRQAVAQQLARQLCIGDLINTARSQSTEALQRLRVLALLLEADVSLAKAVMEANGGEVLVRNMCNIHSGEGTYQTCANVLLKLAHTSKTHAEDLAALKDLPEAIELGIVDEAGDSDLSLMLMAAFIDSAVGARLARRVPSGVGVAAGTLGKAARMTASGITEAMADRATHAAIVIAGIARHSSAAMLNELTSSIPHLVHLGEFAEAAGGADQSALSCPLHVLLKLSAACVSALSATNMPLPADPMTIGLALKPDQLQVGTASTVPDLVAIVRTFNSHVAQQMLENRKPACGCRHAQHDDPVDANFDEASSAAANALAALSSLISSGNPACRESILSERVVPVCVALLRLWSSSHSHHGQRSDGQLSLCSAWEPKLAAVVSILKALVVSASTGDDHQSIELVSGTSCWPSTAEASARAESAFPGIARALSLSSSISIVNPLARVLRCASWPTAAEAAGVLYLMSEDSVEGGGLEQLSTSKLATAELLRFVKRSIVAHDSPYAEQHLRPLRGDLVPSSSSSSSSSSTSAAHRRDGWSGSGLGSLIGATESSAWSATSEPGDRYELTAVKHRAGMFGLCTLTAICASSPMSSAMSAAAKPGPQDTAAKVASLCLQWHFVGIGCGVSSFSGRRLSAGSNCSHAAPLPSPTSAAATLRHLARLEDGPLILVRAEAVGPLLQAAQLGSQKLRSTAVAALHHVRRCRAALEAIVTVRGAAEALLSLMCQEGQISPISKKAVSLLAALPRRAYTTMTTGDGAGMRGLLAFMQQAVEVGDERAISAAARVILRLLDHGGELQPRDTGVSDAIPVFLSALRATGKNAEPSQTVILKVVSKGLSCSPEVNCEAFHSHGGMEAVLRTLDTQSKYSPDADGNASEALRTADVAIGILRIVSAIDVKAGRRHTCTLAAQRVLAAVIRNDPTAPSAAGAMSCLALGRRWTDNRVRQPETAGLVESLLQVFRLDKPLLLESLCASVAIVGALTCTAEGCQLLASQAEATAGMMSVLLQALAAAAETMSPSFFDVPEGAPTLRGEANHGPPSSNDATADSVFAAGTAWIVQSEEECCRKVLSTPESLLGVMLRMPQLSLQGCILRMVANFCRNTQDASDVLAGPAVEAMCGVLKNVCIRYHMPESRPMFEAKLTLPLHLLLQAVETLTAQASRTSDIVVRTSCVPHLVALLSEVVDRRGILKAQKSYGPEAHICRILASLCSAQAGAIEVIESGGHLTMARLVRARLLTQQHAMAESIRELAVAAATALASISQWRAVMLRLDAEIDRASVLSTLLAAQPEDPTPQASAPTPTPACGNEAAGPPASATNKKDDRTTQWSSQQQEAERRLSELNRWSASCKLEMTNASTGMSGWQTANDSSSYCSFDSEGHSRIIKSAAAMKASSFPAARTLPSGPQPLPVSQLPTDRFINSDRYTGSATSCCSETEMANTSMSTSGWQTARDFNHRSSNYEVRAELGRSAAIETPSYHVARTHPAGHLPPSPLPTDRFIASDRYTCSAASYCSDVAPASSVESVLSLYDSFCAEDASRMSVMA